MEALGHRTASIFRRYAITTEDDKRNALGAVAAATRAKQGHSEESASEVRTG